MRQDAIQPPTLNSDTIRKNLIDTIILHRTKLVYYIMYAQLQKKEQDLI